MSEGLKQQRIKYIPELFINRFNWKMQKKTPHSSQENDTQIHLREKQTYNFKKGRRKQGGGKETLDGTVGEAERQAVREKRIMGFIWKVYQKLCMFNFMLYKNFVGVPGWHSRLSV